MLLALTPMARASEDDGPIGRVSNFTLTERGGQTVTRQSLEGKVWVASFLITNCPDGKCPQVATTVERLQKELANRKDVVLVTFTTDPTRDTPDKLNTYANGFHADPERWLFLTGTEEQIDQVLRSFLMRGKEESFQKGRIDHSQKLLVVDRHGDIRGVYDGLDDPRLPEGYFETNLRKLKRQVDQLRAPDLPAWMPKDFPAFNASLNACAAVLLLLGYAAIRQRLVKLHITCMLTAIVVSAIFLTSYLFYHLYVKQGQPTRFAEQAPDAPAWVGYLYLAILGTHTVLAIPTAPLALISAYRGLRGQLPGHVRLAKWTLPIWLYVSITGVVVYWMLYRLYPLP